jgi:probable rRNA maturation factor
MTRPADPAVFFYFDDVTFSLRNRKRLKHFVAKIFKSKKKILGRLTYIFSTDRRILQINRQYLNHDFYTDVIAFDLSDTPRSVHGEVYISIDRVKQNANTFNVTISEELYRVIVHAALHLCGYRDKTASERATMKIEEDRYLAQYLKLFHVKQSS